MGFKQEMEIYLRSKLTVIWVISYEEERIINCFKELCEASNRTLMTWDLAAGFLGIANVKGTPPNARDPKTALDVVEKADINIDSVYVLKDFHICLDKQPLINRQLRNLAQRLKYTRKSIVITSPVSMIPDELKDDVFIVDFPSPALIELEEILDQLTKTPRIKTDLTNLGREKVLRSALGLSANQAQRAFGNAIIAELKNDKGKIIKPAGTIDERSIDMITNEKKSIIRDSGALEFYSPKEKVTDVGGLDILKEWLRTRERAFSREAYDYGLPSPKGIALIGIPGSGKSLTAKMVSGLWHLPLVRLDVGALFGSLVGQSEENTRRALSIVETVSPCILWIDEMEKGFSVGDGDGGTSQRVIQSILTWMQEKKKPVFVIGTANNIDSLPPEFLRKGRFDEIFFLDLPTQMERKEIFQVHIEKRKRPSQLFNLDALAKSADGYVGAEIEQAVIDAMYFAFNDRKNSGRDFTTDDILQALSRQVPLSRSQRAAIDHLRTWLKEGRAQSASKIEKENIEGNILQWQMPQVSES